MGEKVKVINNDICLEEKDDDRLIGSNDVKVEIISNQDKLANQIEQQEIANKETPKSKEDSTWATKSHVIEETNPDIKSIENDNSDETKEHMEEGKDCIIPDSVEEMTQYESSNATNLKEITQDDIDCKIVEELNKTQEDQETNDDIILQYHATSIKDDQVVKSKNKNEQNPDYVQSDSVVDIEENKVLDNDVNGKDSEELVCHVSDQGDLSDKMDVKQENIVSKVDIEMHNFKDDQEINSSEDKKGDSEMNMDTIKDGKLKSKNEEIKETIDEIIPKEDQNLTADCKDFEMSSDAQKKGDFGEDENQVVEEAGRVDASTDQIKEND